MMGHQFRRGVEMVFAHTGSTILIHKNWTTPDQKTTEDRGSVAKEKSLFCFLERHEIAGGNVLQQKGGNDLWRVVDREGEIMADTFIQLHVSVEKLNAPMKKPKGGNNFTIHGSMYGAVQVG